MNLIRELKTFDFFFRKKHIDNKDNGETKLARVLNTLDLTALGYLLFFLNILNKQTIKIFFFLII